MAKRRLKLRTRAAELSGKEKLSGPTRGAAGVTKASTRPGGKKRARARERVERQRAFVARELGKRGALADAEAAPGLSLHDLGRALKDTERAAPAAKAASRPTHGGGASSRARRHRVREETAQMASVCANPAFQADPVEALRQHLLNTVCAAPQQVPPALSGDAPGAAQRSRKNDAEEGDGAKKKKKKKKGAHAGIALEASREALAQAREDAKDRVREKRERKADMERAATMLRRQGRGVEKTRSSPQARGRIGVKRPKILDE